MPATKRTLALALVALLVALMPALLGAPTADGSGLRTLKCRIYVNADAQRVTYADGLFSHKWVDVSGGVIFRQCVNRHTLKRYVDPISYVVKYNVEGSDIACDWPNAYNGVAYNAYFWDQRGVNYNPGPDELVCSSNTTNETVRSLSMAPNFKRMFENPKWKINITVRLRGEPDKHAVLSGEMWAWCGIQPCPNLP